MILLAVATELPQSSLEQWRLVGKLFVSLDIGDFKNDILSIRDPLPEYDLQQTVETFSTLINASIIAEYDPTIHCWKLQLLE